MTTIHVGLVCGSEENADKFYRDLLGMKRAEPKVLPQKLSGAIFNIDADLKIINYIGEAAHFEIFIHRREARQDRPIAHVCLEVTNVADLLKRGRALNVKTLQVPKGDMLLSFMYDFDGNLFELKEKPGA